MTKRTAKRIAAGVRYPEFRYQGSAARPTLDIPEYVSDGLQNFFGGAPRSVKKAAAWFRSMADALEQK